MGKLEGKKPLGIPARIWDNNIKMGVIEHTLGQKVVNRFNLAKVS
jgi:transposase